MYIITFYSFKGGVGRTMALLNIAVEMAKSGRKVLVVDFDVEAPGIDTYKLPRPDQLLPGVVDYVVQYGESRAAPTFRDFCYQCQGVGDRDGALWVMPSGKRDEEYGQRLASIDWQRLYDEREGFLLFENLKADWAEFGFDYVLVDSRTGHTDEGGICTRQLPDAVAVFFHPDEQNLRGLEKVVQAIRNEETGPRQKDIRLHFVMSNVPDLDDEDEILAGCMREFRDHLDYDELAGIIHRYNSLALLKQIVFTSERPKSRLADEYRRLFRALVRQNIEDREGALTFFSDRARQQEISRDTSNKIEDTVRKIRKIHASDAEVLKAAGAYLRRQLKLKEAQATLETANRLSPNDPETLLSMAETHHLLNEKEQAVQMALSVLAVPGADYFDIDAAIGRLRVLNPRSLKSLPRAAGVAALDFDERTEIATDLYYSREELEVAEEMLRALLADSAIPDESAKSIRSELALCLIGQGRFSEAARTIKEGWENGSAVSTQDAFNYAMANWAQEGKPSTQLFQTVIKLDQTERGETANYFQCLSIAFWAVGDWDQALSRLTLARDKASIVPDREFSAWRYLRIPSADFLADLEQQERMIRGEALSPEFFTAAKVQIALEL